MTDLRSKAWTASSSRRAHLRTLAALPLALGTPPESWRALVASAPDDFRPLVAPGVVARAEAPGSFAEIMQPNQLWPRADIAKRALSAALMALTGAPDLNAAVKRFVHPKDVVAIKVNGIAGQLGHTMAVNFELILPLVEAVLAAGVPAEKVTVYEQYPTYMMGTRVNVRGAQLPAGVRAETHNNRDIKMSKIAIFEKVQTAFCRQFTEATAVINMTMMKDHSICGFTGALKNITHGSIINPHDHHAHQASPQIAALYAHPIVQSRVRLHIVDAFKIIYDRGPLDKDPRMRVPHGSVYAATDPLALDRIGWGVIDRERVARGGRILEAVGRRPTYLERAADLKLGWFREEDIRLRHVKA